VFSGYSFWYKKGLKIEFNDIFHVRWFIYAFETITLIMELVNWSRKEPTNEVRFCSTGILYFIHKIVRKIGQNQRCCQVSLSAQKLSTIDGVAEGRDTGAADGLEENGFMDGVLVGYDVGNRIGFSYGHDFLSTQSSRLSGPLRYILNVSWSWPSLRRLLSLYCYPPGWFRPPNSNLALSFVVMRDKTAEHCKSKKHSDKNRQSPAPFVFLNQKWLLHWDCKSSLNKSTKKLSK